jgi:hypothetical protein
MYDAVHHILCKLPKQSLPQHNIVKWLQTESDKQQHSLLLHSNYQASVLKVCVLWCANSVSEGHLELRNSQGNTLEDNHIMASYSTLRYWQFLKYCIIFIVCWQSWNDVCQENAVTCDECQFFVKKEPAVSLSLSLCRSELIAYFCIDYITFITLRHIQTVNCNQKDENCFTTV